MIREPIAATNTVVRVQSSPADGIAGLDALTARRLLFSIFAVNAFERCVIELKAADCVWGPIHISIGQEATAAAVAAALRPTDKITGSHRAHHVTLAKILEHVLPPDWDPVAAVDRATAAGVPAVSGLPEAAKTALYRTLAEIMGLRDGYCGGRGGSMHLRCVEAGVLGTNAIVAGGVPLSVGAALAARRRGTDAVVVAFMGDGAVNQGAFHEACNLAALWRLPVLFVVENNQYAVATSVKQATAVPELATLATAYAMPGYQVLGYDVAALYRVTREIVTGMRTGNTQQTGAEGRRVGGGPAILEVKGYRHLHHGGDLQGSRFGYRTTAEEADWLARDAYSQFPKLLVAAGIVTSDTVEQLRAMVEAAVQAARDRCVLPASTPLCVRPELWPAPESVTEGVRSDGHELIGLPYMADEPPTPAAAAGSTAGAQTAAAASNAGGAPGAPRAASGVAGSAAAGAGLKYSDAIAAVTGRWLEKDPTTIVLGEEVANFGGGAYGATKGLPDRYPDRVINTPISEAGFCGVGLGAAMNGLKPIIEIMFPDFSLVAADQIFNQIGKARHMYGNTTDLPLVLRTRVGTGCGYGGQHSMDPVALYAMFPGWRILAPADSREYIGLFNTAMHSLDPVVILEHHSLYGVAAPVPADLDYCIPFGTARIVRRGSTLTALCYSSMVQRVRAIADELASDDPAVDIEVIDLRCLDVPSLDRQVIGESIATTGAAVTVEQAAAGHAIGERLAAMLTAEYFDFLDAPIGVLTAQDVPNPVSRRLEAAAMLSDDAIRTALRAMALRQWQ